MVLLLAAVPSAFLTGDPGGSRRLAGVGAIVVLLLLDRHELEAVLVHEVAHLARRDAAVIEICSAPSNVLLAYTGGLWTLRFPGWGLGQLLSLWVFAWLCVPPALVLAWLSRLPMLGSSRARSTRPTRR